MHPRGFTLIELLVVIAIIGILASITLLALGGARTQGSDTGIKGNLNTVRTQVEVYLTVNDLYTYVTETDTGIADQNGCGTTGMWADPTIKQAIVSASAQAGTNQLNGVSEPLQTVVCKSTPNSWFVAVVLKSNPEKMWCVDSEGKAKESQQNNVNLLSQVNNLTKCPN